MSKHALQLYGFAYGGSIGDAWKTMQCDDDTVDSKNELLLLINMMIDEKNKFDPELYVKNLQASVNVKNLQASVNVKNLQASVNDKNFIAKIAIIGVLFDDLDKCILNAFNVIKACRTNSNNLDCIGCVVIVSIVYHIMHNSDYNLFDMSDIEKFISSLVKNALSTIKLSSHELDTFTKYVNFTDLNKLEISSLKIMACAFWTLRNINIGFTKIMSTVYANNDTTKEIMCVSGHIAGMILTPLNIPHKYIEKLELK